MAAPKEIIQVLNGSFPRPRVDPEWLEQCCSWIQEEQNLSPINNFDQFLEIVNEQLIRSDLADSMERGTGLRDISTFTGTLPGPPLLVQIMEITDIGMSAFQLDQVRAAREERMFSGEGNEEGDEDGDVEVEGEGPLPKYPRATLHLKLSDGVTFFPAIEYRPIPQLVLGTTPLGFKLQLKGTQFSNGIAFLEPATIILIGRLVDDLERTQPILFKQSLYRRMGQPFQEEAPTPNSRAPLRDISPPAPTLHDDDVDMEPRRRLPTSPTVSGHLNSTSDLNPSREIRPLPSRQGRPSIQKAQTESAREDLSHMSNTKSLVPSSSTSPHFHGNYSSPQRGQAVERVIKNALDFSFSPTTRQQATALSSDSPVQSRVRGKQSESQSDSFDFDLLDEVDNDQNTLPKSNKKGKGRATDRQQGNKNLIDGYSSDYGMDDDKAFADSSFLESLIQVEKQAPESSQISPDVFPPTSTAQQSQALFISRTKPTPSTSALDVTQLDNDDESDGDKENTFVPMRHVRQRREESSQVMRGRSPTTSQRWENSRGPDQKKGKVVVNPDDVIDISDSD